MNHSQNRPDRLEVATDFWTRLRAFVPGSKAPESLFEKYPWPQEAASTPRKDARALQELLAARLAVMGLGGR